MINKKWSKQMISIASFLGVKVPKTNILVKTDFEVYCCLFQEYVYNRLRFRCVLCLALFPWTNFLFWDLRFRFVCQFDTWFYFLQLWLVLYICSRLGLYFADLLTRLHHQANGEPVEDLCETLCYAYGFSWTYQRFTGFS